jgi:hypothetical protein
MEDPKMDVSGTMSPANLTYPTSPQTADGSRWFRNGLGVIGLPTQYGSICAGEAGAGHGQPSVNPSMTGSETKETAVPMQSSPTYEVAVFEGRKCYRCECGHKTTRKGDMDRHHESLRHSQRRRYQCSCGAKFTRKSALKRHEAKCN